MTHVNNMFFDVFVGDMPIFWGSFVSPRVQQLAASAAAFAARTTEGHVVTWGHPDYGGDGAETSGECL